MLGQQRNLATAEKRPAAEEKFIKKPPEGGFFIVRILARAGFYTGCIYVSQATIGGTNKDTCPVFVPVEDQGVRADLISSPFGRHERYPEGTLDFAFT